MEYERRELQEQLLKHQRTYLRHVERLLKRAKKNKAEMEKFAERVTADVAKHQERFHSSS